MDFLDSTGVGAVAGSLKRLREQHGSLKLVTAADRIPTIFRLTGLVHSSSPRRSPATSTSKQSWPATAAARWNGAANTKLP